MTTGLISFDEFTSLVKNFVEISNKIDDNWRLEYGTHGGMYMCKRVQVLPATHVSEKATMTRSNPNELSALAQLHSPDNTKLEDRDFLLDMEMESETDEGCMPTADTFQQQPLTYEYHVVYSESYSVPVLFFNIFKPNGKRLSLEEVWKLCPSAYQSYMTENRWSTLTQQEHPILGRPYLQLHPCHTSDLMAQVTTGLKVDGRQNYLVTWLSTVGPMAGLQISPEYIT